MLHGVGTVPPRLSHYACFACLPVHVGVVSSARRTMLRVCARCFRTGLRVHAAAWILEMHCTPTRGFAGGWPAAQWITSRTNQANCTASFVSSTLAPLPGQPYRRFLPNGRAQSSSACLDFVVVPQGIIRGTVEEARRRLVRQVGSYDRFLSTHTTLGPLSGADCFYYSVCVVSA